MKIIKVSTKKGQNMYLNAMNFEGVYLHEIYNNYSPAKAQAWEWCRAKCNEEHGKAFGICSHNTFGFSVSWVTDEGMRIETPQNSYLIVGSLVEV